MIKFRRILLPTDFSANSRIAQAYACDLVEQHQAELHLLHVTQEMVLVAADPLSGFVMPAADTDAAKAGAERELKHFLNPEWTAQRRVVYAVRNGSPFVEVVRYAREHEIDLIVISTHGRTGLAHVLLGSAAENIVRTAPCPVLTVRPTDHKYEAP